MQQEEEDDYFASEEFQDILSSYEQAMEAGNTPYMDSDELVDVADYYMSQGKHAQAQEATELALKLHPDAEDSVTMMADIMFESGQWQKAIEWLDKVLDNDPYDLQAWLNMADSQLQCGLIAEALDSAEYTLAIEPDNMHALLQKAYATSRQDRYQEAADLFEQYLVRCPDDELALYHAAFNLCFLERYGDANEMLIQAEDISQGLSPEHLNICLQRSYTEARLGHMQEAKDALERSKKFKDADTPVDYNLLTGHIYLMFHDIERAVEHFSTALSESKDHMHTMRSIAHMFMDTQDYDTATDILLEIEKMVHEPEYDESRAEIIKAICPSQAYCHYQTGHKAEFMHYLQMAVRLNPKDSALLFRDIFPRGANPEDYPYYADRLWDNNQE